jgi:excisionase family DNA binding protein
MTTTTDTPTRRCWTVKEAAAVLGVTAKGVYHAVAAGNLPSIRIGGRILIPKELLDALIAAPPSER